RSHAGRPLELPPLGLGIDPVQLDRLRLLLLVPVDSDDHPLARLDLLRVAEGSVLDLALDEALLDGGHRPAELVHPFDQLPRLRLELVGQRLDELRTAWRV